MVLVSNNVTWDVTCCAWSPSKLLYSEVDDKLDEKIPGWIDFEVTKDFFGYKHNGAE